MLDHRFVGVGMWVAVAAAGCADTDAHSYALRSAELTPLCRGDLNGDGLVDAADSGVMFGQWGPCEGCSADFDLDGVVDAADAGVLFGGWGVCPGSLIETLSASGSLSASLLAVDDENEDEECHETPILASDLGTGTLIRSCSDGDATATVNAGLVVTPSNVSASLLAQGQSIGELGFGHAGSYGGYGEVASATYRIHTEQDEATLTLQFYFDALVSSDDAIVGRPTVSLWAENLETDEYAELTASYCEGEGEGCPGWYVTGDLPNATADDPGADRTEFDELRAGLGTGNLLHFTMAIEDGDRIAVSSIVTTESTAENRIGWVGFTGHPGIYFDGDPGSARPPTAQYELLGNVAVIDAR